MKFDKPSDDGLSQLNSLTKKQKACPFTLYSLENKYHVGHLMLDYCHPGLREKIFALTYYAKLDFLSALKVICSKNFKHTEEIGYLAVLKNYLDLSYDEAKKMMYSADVDMLDFFVNNMSEIIDVLKERACQHRREQIHVVQDDEQV